jgi:hypothetical protein
MEIFIYFLIFGAVFGVIGFLIAQNKHVSPGVGFWLGALLGPIGLIIVALLSPTDEKEAEASTSPASPKSHPVSKLRSCPHCAEDIKAEAIKCRFCGSAVDAMASRCDFCSQVVHLPVWPCSSVVEARRRELAPTIRNPTCRATLAQRGELDTTLDPV